MNYKSIVYGGIPDGLGKKEFFEGYTITRSKEIMRIYRDMELVKQLDSGKCITIKELAETIQEIVGHEGDIQWDRSKPDGTPRKLMDVSKMNAQGWKAKIDLKEGIRDTYQWFLDNAYREVKVK